MSCGKSSTPGTMRGRRVSVFRGGPDELFGLDVENMSPRARISAAVAALAPVTLSGVLLLVFAPGLWWVFTIYGWVAFPALGLLARGMAESSPSRLSDGDHERELLAALRRHGALTPVGVASETSLSVVESDQLLGELAGAGHLEVRARGGAIFYALWEAEPRDATLEAERP